MNSSSLTTTQHQQLLSQLMCIKKNQLSSSTLTSLLQTPIQSRSLSNDSIDGYQPKFKRFKGSDPSSKKIYRKLNHVMNFLFFFVCSSSIYLDGQIDTIVVITNDTIIVYCT